MLSSKYFYFLEYKIKYAYCFACHEYKSDVECTTCERTYHKMCLSPTEDASTLICSACQELNKNEDYL